MAKVKNEAYIKYLVSKIILDELLGASLITEKELEAIDLENRKVFQSLENQRFDLIS